MNKDISFLKIIYFDEESATDLIYMKNKGKVIESIEKNAKKEMSTKGKVEGEINASNSIFSLVGLKFGLGIDATATKGSEKLINQAITNTLLTDYLELSKNENNIIKFEKSCVKPYENSLSFYKIITPYMLMTEGTMDAGDVKVNVQLMDNAIRNAKGYYELILTDSSNKSSILRFNLKSFKNSYSLTDLIKMELTYHAVKVGKIHLSDLNIEKEFSFSNNFYIDGAKLENEHSDEKIKKVEVFDVILAGVEND